MVVEVNKEKGLQLKDNLFIEVDEGTLRVTQFGSQLYKDFKTKYSGSELDVLFDRLVTPILNEKFRFEASNIEIETVKPNSYLGEMADDVVNFSYNLRYVKDGGELVDVSADREDFQEKFQILVAKQKLGDGDIVFATFRVVYGGDLNVFKLFELAEEEKWPHDKNIDTSVNTVNKPGELERFSLHPIFDYIDNPEDKRTNTKVKVFKQHLLREMWPSGMELLKQNEITHPYFILAPHVRTFVELSGIHPSKIEGVVPGTSDYAKGIRNDFKIYWNPDGDLEEQPKVYLAPWQVEG